MGYTLEAIPSHLQSYKTNPFGAILKTERLAYQKTGASNLHGLIERVSDFLHCHSRFQLYKETNSLRKVMILQGEVN